ncbi:D-alanyl-D-alanine carboxypeptidase family protein [Marinicrinis sediminis]|uniref:D-alanyl-D-alanine carboxypeptidase family protein n=1 Tax=Marinicrinis sediminis TaxID=1652465 RepID=A0ABW5RCR4_9BACL
MKASRVWIMIVLLSMLWTLTGGTVTANHHQVDTSAQSAALIDVESGRVLYSHQGNQQMRIASLTKIMTAIVAIEHSDLSSRVKVSRQAYGKEGSSIYLKLGEEMTLEHMLYGLMLRSGNDAATAIAEHVGGSVEGFALLMNQKAEAIGMTHSQFRNPHGLDEDGHYSTAVDMAKLSAYALRNETFREIVKTTDKKVPNPNESWDYTWRNKNKMLHMFEGADGVKTGYTKAAGRCLVSSATRKGQQLAVVTLNDPNDWHDHRQLLEYGFTTYPLHELVKSGQGIPGHTDWVAGRTIRYPLQDQEKQEVQFRIQTTHPSSLDARLGLMGTLVFTLGNETMATVPIYEENDVRVRESHSPTVAATADDKGFLASFLATLECVLTGKSS